jgi:hypothetical protein
MHSIRSLSFCFGLFFSFFLFLFLFLHVLCEATQEIRSNQHRPYFQKKITNQSFPVFSHNNSRKWKKVVQRRVPAMEDGIVANFVHEGRLVPFQGQAKRGTRVCCISDTHLVHSQIEVPFGDVLVHSGDVLTESLLRHVEGDGSAKNRGVELFTDFAKWFCAQPHSFKARERMGVLYS